MWVWVVYAFYFLMGFHDFLTRTFCDILPPKRSIFIFICHDMPTNEDYLVITFFFVKGQISRIIWKIMKVALIKKVKMFLDYVAFHFDLFDVFICIVLARWVIMAIQGSDSFGISLACLLLPNRSSSSI